MDQPLPALVNDLAFVQVVIWIRNAVETPTDHKFVKMIILPTHNNLEDVMQLAESRVLPNLDSTPDGWIDITQRHFELVQHAVFLSHSILAIGCVARRSVRFGVFAQSRLC